MNRRSFVETLGSAGMLAGSPPSPAAAAQRTNYYLLQNIYLKNGSEVARIHDVFKACGEVIERLHSGPRLFLDALVAPHMPQVLAIYGYPSVDDLLSTNRKMRQHEEIAKVFDAWELGPEPPYEHYSQTVLQAASYSPEIARPSEAPKTRRIFELRTYHSPTWRQLGALHDRFAGPEIKIFHRSGIHPLFYTSTVFGQNMPNLTYLIPFDDLAAREKAWNAFGADPEWVKVRKESVDKNGEISSVIQISLYRATDYSPIR